MGISINQTVKSNACRAFLAILMTILTIGCGSGSHTDDHTLQASNEFSVPIPTLLGTHLTAVNTDLTAEVSVEGQCAPTPRTIPLIIDITNRRVTAQIDNLLTGNCTFTIAYKVNNVTVATGTETAVINAGATTPVNFDPIRYVDSDRDGFTNLAELEIFGHNNNAWNDFNTKPAAEIPRSSANYVMVDAIGGPFLVGVSSSSNYTLTSGL